MAERCCAAQQHISFTVPYCLLLTKLPLLPVGQKHCRTHCRRYQSTSTLLSQERKGPSDRKTRRTPRQQGIKADAEMAAETKNLP